MILKTSSFIWIFCYLSSQSVSIAYIFYQRSLFKAEIAGLTEIFTNKEKLLLLKISAFDSISKEKATVISDVDTTGSLSIPGSAAFLLPSVEQLFIGSAVCLAAALLWFYFPDLGKLVKAADRSLSVVSDGVNSTLNGAEYVGQNLVRGVTSLTDGVSQKLASGTTSLGDIVTQAVVQEAPLVTGAASQALCESTASLLEVATQNAESFAVSSASTFTDELGEGVLLSIQKLLLERGVSFDSSQTSVEITSAMLDSLGRVVVEEVAYSVPPLVVSAAQQVANDEGAKIFQTVLDKVFG